MIEEMLALYLEKILCNNISRAKEIEIKILAFFSAQEQQIAALTAEVERLKCCGNCKNHYVINCDFLKIEKHPDQYCDNWQSDNLTREERNGTK